MMMNWMSMATNALTNSSTTFLLHKTIIPFSLTKTSPFLISFTTPSRSFLSASSLPSLSADHTFNLSDSGHYFSISIFFNIFFYFCSCFLIYWFCFMQEMEIMLQFPREVQKCFLKGWLTLNLKYVFFFISVFLYVLLSW